MNKRSKGTPANTAPDDQPVGWQYIQDNDLNDDSSDYWVKMHLLPDAIGGPARGKNLVPASGPGSTSPSCTESSSTPRTPSTSFTRARNR
ncbi:hypothetical protein WKI71_05695 [Streptomyces sp. MS1.AVA.1]|uniref:Uncharacterized protein n=1 Tax=Streptomyces machairae TaxID=3134109 RepID=A0ABU8UIA5_9ACTN